MEPRAAVESQYRVLYLFWDVSPRRPNVTGTRLLKIVCQETRHFLSL